MKQFFKKLQRKNGGRVSVFVCVMLAMVMAFILPFGSFAKEPDRVFFYNSFDDLQPYPEVIDWDSGCYVCSIAMILSYLGYPNATPIDVWRMNENSTFITWLNITDGYGINMISGELGDDPQENYVTIFKLCRQYPQGVMISGTTVEDTNHAVVAYIQNDTLYIDNPGFTGWRKHIVGLDDKNFVDYSQFNEFHIFGPARQYRPRYGKNPEKIYYFIPKEWVSGNQMEYQDICHSSISDQHKYESIIATEATCISDGIRTNICKNCGKISTETIEAYGHDFEKIENEPSCLVAGSITYSCQKCGYSYGYEIPAKNHEFTKEEITATCTAAGKVTYTCQDCSYSFNRMIVAKGHDLGDDLLPKAALKYNGLFTKRCRVCNEEVAIKR